MKLNFSAWLKTEADNYSEDDFQNYKRMVLGSLGLDSVEGMNASLNSYEPDVLITKMKKLGMFTQLPQEKQQAVFDKIKGETGTIKDLIVLMASR